jgi:hypothetical protein
MAGKKQYLVAVKGVKGRKNDIYGFSTAKAMNGFIKVLMKKRLKYATGTMKRI